MNKDAKFLILDWIKNVADLKDLYKMKQYIDLEIKKELRLRKIEELKRLSKLKL